MNIPFKGLRNHTVKIYEKCLGAVGDHLTNTLSVSLSDCGHKFVRAKIHFVLPNGKTYCTDFLTVSEEQTVEYPLPYPIFVKAGFVTVSLSAETEDEKQFSVENKEFYICESARGTEIIDETLADKEELERLKTENARLENIILAGGADGASAYDIAVKNGFEGTEAEWLASLKGADGKDGIDGYTPVKGVDYFDGADGKDGIDGYTPVKGVDYFDGADGKDGIDGYTPVKGVDYFDGADGKDGIDGKDGYTPIKGVDYFDGENGKDGANGYTPIKGVDYFTEADKTDMVNAVLSMIPIYNGEVIEI